MAGAVVAARHNRAPVVLDGSVVTAAVAVLECAVPGALDHCVAGHVSGEPGHRLLLEKLGKEPLLDLGMRLGEASGAAVALGVLSARWPRITAWLRSRKPWSAAKARIRCKKPP